MKIIISENQLRLINEALGVPDNIFKGAEMIYDIISNHLKKIRNKNDSYNFSGKLKIELGGKKKVKLNSYTLQVNVNEIEDNEDGVIDIASMSVSANFGFDREKLLKFIPKSKTLELTLNYIAGENWKPEELYKILEEEKEEHISSFAHELKHKYDKQVKKYGLIGDDADYQSTQIKDNFGIPTIDDKFFRYLYYISMVENLVRPTEVATSMVRKNITKSQFRDFLENNRVYNELLEIKNFTFDKFISEIKSEMDRVDALLDHLDEDYENMTEDEKIKRVLELVYISIVNSRMDLFVQMTTHDSDDFLKMLSQVGLTGMPKNTKNALQGLEKTNEVRMKFLNFTKRFQDDPIKFFEFECENFNYVANKILKKLSKLYAMAKDDEAPVSESILNWELHQQIMEKKYGKRKIETKYKY